ncbi:MAG: phage/plasmid primase, P4 family [Planctomycetia bacterium]|nr:phage/plasmid primase, P4 family [Planctomycetia bacterium]
MDFADQQSVFEANVTPGMAGVLADKLGVTAASLMRLGLGWWPIENAWTFPERDAEGKVIGLIRRFWDGQKFCVKDAKRGLTYVATAVEDGYDPSRQTWLRVTDGYVCPICGGVKWCGVDGNVTPPRFVRCMRKAEGSVYDDARGGHIHELVPGAFRPPLKYRTPLESSALPVLVVEGQTDTAAGLDLGFVTVGRPSAQGGLKLLAELLRGRKVVVLGENDSGAGKEGMDKTYEALKPGCPEVVKVLPPEEFKDLREWKNRGGLDQEGLLAAVKDGSTTSDSTMLEDKAPLAIAERWLREYHTAEGMPILRKFKGEWFRWNGEAYDRLDEDAGVRGSLYRFLADKMFKTFSPGGDMRIQPFEATRSKVSDIVDALTMTCPVKAEPPCWLDGRQEPRMEDIVVFKNGILDVAAYLAGTRKCLIPPTPNLFVQAAVPYEFDAKAACPTWIEFLGQVFDNDPGRTALLQEWFGYNMVSDTSMEKFMLMIGRPASGKSTVLDVMQSVMGRHQCAKSSFASLCSDFGLWPLLGKLAIILPDAHVPRQVDAIQALERIKSITGGDGMSVNRKYLPQLPDEKLPGRFTIAVNEMPELPDHARSLSRRLVMLDFPITFEGREDRSLKRRLPEEAPGIMVWALEGLRRLRQQGYFTTPPSSVPVAEEFQRFLTPIGDFLDECCELKNEPGGWTLKTQMYDAWSMWAKERGLRVGAHSRFGQRLMAQNPQIEASRVRTKGGLVHAYMGIVLTEAAKDRYLSRAR